MSRIHAVVLFAACLAVPAQAGTSEESYREARTVLDAGIQALGGLETLQAIKDVRRVGQGTGYHQGQSLLPDAPMTTRTVEITSVMDFSGRRSWTETVAVPAGNLPTKARAVLSGDSGFNHNLVTGIVTPTAAGGVTGAKTTLRRDPAALLLTALGRAETLRSLGETTFDGRKHRVLTFADADGAQLGLYFDTTSGLLSKWDTWGDNAVLGDVLTETVLSDYKDVPVGTRSARLPMRLLTRVGGDVTLDLRYTDVRVNSGAAAELFEIPKDTQTLPPAAPGTGVEITRLSDDVYLAGGGSHHSLFVAFKDHVVVVEGPLGEERSLAVMAKIAETVPGRPIRYVVPTHYHFDHSGGLRTYVAKGVTVLTTPGNKAFFERLAAATRTIRPDSLSREPRKPVIETFTGKKVLTDGARTLELHDVGPSPHVAEMVVAYLPKEKVLFEADLLTIPVQGPFAPASPALLAFAEKLQKLGLAVETLVPAHGRVGTLKDLQAALAVR